MKRRRPHKAVVSFLVAALDVSFQKGNAERKTQRRLRSASICIFCGKPTGWTNTLFYGPDRNWGIAHTQCALTHDATKGGCYHG